MTLWQFFKIITLSTYLISRQCVEKRSTDKFMKFYCRCSKIKGVVDLQMNMWVIIHPQHMEGVKRGVVSHQGGPTTGVPLY